MGKNNKKVATIQSSSSIKLKITPNSHTLQKLFHRLEYLSDFGCERVLKTALSLDITTKNTQRFHM
jgi:hypothetical protein